MTISIIPTKNYLVETTLPLPITQKFGHTYDEGQKARSFPEISARVGMRQERACEKSSQEKEKNVTIQAIWDRIEAWLKQYAPEEFSSLQPGATDQDIQEAETALGMTFPEEVRALYRLHNGGALIAHPRSHFLWELLCLEDIVDDWNSSRRFDHGLLAPIQPEDQVQPRNWDLHWIPLLSDAGFGFLYLNLAPGPAGQPGQIVPGHSCWPQNGPFDANLAHLLSCNTASLCKNTTHKTPQSAGRL